PNFSSIVATGSRPPYGVRFLPSKSYGVEAPILLGSGCVAWIACLAALFRLCFFPRLTIWVTSLGFCAAELLPPHPRFYSMFSGVTNWSTSAQPSRIRSRVHNSGDRQPICAERIWRRSYNRHYNTGYCLQSCLLHNYQLTICTRSWRKLLYQTKHQPEL